MPILRVLALALFLSNHSYAIFECAGKRGALEKVGSWHAVGSAGVFLGANYRQLFLLPNGDRFILEVRNSERTVDGPKAEGAKVQTSFTVEYQKFKEYYPGGEGGMAGPRFSSSDKRPRMKRVKTVGNGYRKTKTFELTAGRPDKSTRELLNPELKPTFVIQAVVGYENNSGKWRADTGELVIWQVDPKSKERKQIASISGERALSSIKSSFSY